MKAQTFPRTSTLDVSVISECQLRTAIPHNSLIYLLNPNLLVLLWLSYSKLCKGPITEV